jgi:hypothetical protein
MHNVYFPSVTERPAGLYLIVQPPKAQEPSPEKAADQSRAHES